MKINNASAKFLRNALDRSKQDKSLIENRDISKSVFLRSDTPAGNDAYYDKYVQRGGGTTFQVIDPIDVYVTSLIVKAKGDDIRQPAFFRLLSGSGLELSSLQKQLLLTWSKSIFSIYLTRILTSGRSTFNHIAFDRSSPLEVESSLFSNINDLFLLGEPSDDRIAAKLHQLLAFSYQVLEKLDDPIVSDAVKECEVIIQKWQTNGRMPYYLKNSKDGKSILLSNQLSNLCDEIGRKIAEMIRKSGDDSQSVEQSLYLFNEIHRKYSELIDDRSIYAQPSHDSNEEYINEFSRPVDSSVADGIVKLHLRKAQSVRGRLFNGISSRISPDLLQSTQAISINGGQIIEIFSPRRCHSLPMTMYGQCIFFLLLTDRLRNKNYFSNLNTHTKVLSQYFRRTSQSNGEYFLPYSDESGKASGDSDLLIKFSRLPKELDAFPAFLTPHSNKIVENAYKPLSGPSDNPSLTGLPYSIEGIYPSAYYLKEKEEAPILLFDPLSVVVGHVLQLRMGYEKFTGISSQNDKNLTGMYQQLKTLNTMFARLSEGASLMSSYYDIEDSYGIGVLENARLAFKTMLAGLSGVTTVDAAAQQVDGFLNQGAWRSTLASRWMLLEETLKLASPADTALDNSYTEISNRVKVVNDYFKEVSVISLSLNSHEGLVNTRFRMADFLSLDGLKRWVSGGFQPDDLLSQLIRVADNLGARLLSIRRSDSGLKKTRVQSYLRVHNRSILDRIAQGKSIAPSISHVSMLEQASLPQLVRDQVLDKIKRMDALLSLEYEIWLASVQSECWEQEVEQSKDVLINALLYSCYGKLYSEGMDDRFNLVSQLVYKCADVIDSWANTDTFTKCLDEIKKNAEIPMSFPDEPKLGDNKFNNSWIMLSHNGFNLQITSGQSRLLSDALDDLSRSIDARLGVVKVLPTSTNDLNVLLQLDEHLVNSSRVDALTEIATIAFTPLEDTVRDGLRNIVYSFYSGSDFNLGVTFADNWVGQLIIEGYTRGRTMYDDLTGPDFMVRHREISVRGYNQPVQLKGISINDKKKIRHLQDLLQRVSSVKRRKFNTKTLNLQLGLTDLSANPYGRLLSLTTSNFGLDGSLTKEVISVPVLSSEQLLTVILQECGLTPDSVLSHDQAAKLIEGINGHVALNGIHSVLTTSFSGSQLIGDRFMVSELVGLSKGLSSVKPGSYVRLYRDEGLKEDYSIPVVIKGSHDSGSFALLEDITDTVEIVNEREIEFTVFEAVETIKLSKSTQSYSQGSREGQIKLIHAAYDSIGLGLN